MFDAIFQARATYGVAARGCTAVAVKKGRIAAWLRPGEVADAGRAGVRVVTLGSAVIIPGLWDAHVHLLATGLALKQLDLSGAKDFAELFDLLRGAEDDPLLGCNFDETRLKEGRAPTARELDDAVSDRPLVITRVDLHSLLMNSRAWALWGGEARGPGVDRDAAGPTGGARGVAFEEIRAAIHRTLSPAIKRQALAAAATAAVENGVVALCALEGGFGTGADDVTLLLECQDALPVDVFLWPQVPDVAAVTHLGLPRLGGCILVDGSFGSWTAALYEPYADNPRTSGNLYFEDLALRKLVTSAWEAGLQTAFHAIGDRAVNQVVRAYSGAAGELGRYGTRPRIEHGELIADRDLAAMAAAGVILSAQPAFEARWGGPHRLYARRLGQRWRRTNRWRTARDRGVKVVFGSDSPVTPISPLGGIAAAVNHPHTDESLTLTEALDAFTGGAAYACGVEGEYGDLRPGQWASFTALASDPGQTDRDKLAAISVRATVVRGNVVYRSEEGRDPNTDS